MTFTQLEVFAALARAGSFSRAAALLGITQSAVSHALRALEGELQVQLVRREGPHSPLTDAGTRLLQRANDILQQKEALRQEADAERGMARGTLRVASFGATSSLRLLPPLITEYRRRQPAVLVQIDEQNDDTVVKWLLERRVEIGFVVMPDERFETVPLVEDELVALLPASHRLATQRSIRAADLQGEAFVRTSAGSARTSTASWPRPAPSLRPSTTSSRCPPCRASWPRATPLPLPHAWPCPSRRPKAWSTAASRPASAASPAWPCAAWNGCRRPLPALWSWRGRWRGGSSLAKPAPPTARSADAAPATRARWA